MTSMIVHQMVKDYAAWKKAFDASTELRKSSGELSAQVYRDVNDPNMIITLNKWNSLANAQKFGHSPELKAAMKKAGVVGAPTVYFLNEA